MRKIIIILFCMLGVAVNAVDFTPISQNPEASVVMQSVNNQSYMSTGSNLSPAVYEVGSSSPAGAPKAGGVRKAPPGHGGTVENEDDLKTPGMDTPIGDAVLPLMLMALAFGGYIAIKRRKQTAKN